MLVFKHEVLLAFVGRLNHDREFCEWFAAQPSRALASHGLVRRDLQDLAAILRTDRHQQEIAAALEPAVQVLLDLDEDAEDAGRGSTPEERLARLDAELRAVRDRLAVARTRRRPWWKFW
ncbi:MAG TPA: hypothetical protein VNL16_14060 [Chloroflexota bacterium]|nr:hypothetical protein [Chloroflexota bacterium]